MTLQNLTFVLGGAASGKSNFAENIINLSGRPKVYLATAQAFDDEMKAKIADHRVSRGDSWTTIEEPFDIAAAIAGRAPNEVLLIDCMTLWLTNILLADRNIDADIDQVLSALKTAPSRVVIVSNEVGQGIVPDNALSRQFRAAQGKLNQQLAEISDTVVAVMAGLPFVLKGDLPS